jgi:hypothetical protein
MELRGFTMSNHYLPRPLKLSPSYDKKGTRAIWARKPNGKAVVFIHGYGGDALTTWTEFNKHLPESPGFEQYDFIFYGHDGLYTTTAASAELFYVFLNQLFTEPLTIINPTLPVTLIRPAEFQYSKIILAAHSLGAVICRLSLLVARERNHTWMNKTTLVLYAPAHMGAKVVDLVLESRLGILSSFLSSIVRFSSPLIDELAPESLVLQALRQKTLDAINAGNSPYLIAKKVVFAAKERIVQNVSFLQDPAPLTFAGTTHFSVCKPKLTFLDPIEVLRGV